MRTPGKLGILVRAYGLAYLLVTGLLTAGAGYLLHIRGLSALSSLIYFKVLTSAGLAGMTYRRKHPERLFYSNVGYRPAYLLASAVVADLLLWLTLTLLLL